MSGLDTPVDRPVDAPRPLEDGQKGMRPRSSQYLRLTTSEKWIAWRCLEGSSVHVVPVDPLSRRFQ